MTGESTRCTLLSSMSISRALAHNAFTSCSCMISHRFSCSICRSRSLLESYILDIGSGKKGREEIATTADQTGLVHTCGGNKDDVNHRRRPRGDRRSGGPADGGRGDRRRITERRRLKYHSPA